MGARGFASRLLAVLACVALPLALISVWVSTTVTSTDRYVATVAPLADDPVVERAVVTRLEELALKAIDARGPALGDRAQALVADTVHKAVVRVVQGEEFRPAWELANRSAHQQLIAALSGDSTLVDRDGRVSISLSTLLNAVLDILVDKGLTVLDRVPDVQATFPVLDADQLARAQRAYSLIDRLGVAIPVLAIALAVLSILIARRRRSALAWLGWSGLIAGLVVLVALLVARTQVVDAVTASAADRDLAQQVWSVLVRNLRTWAIVTAVLGVVIAVASRFGARRAQFAE